MGRHDLVIIDPRGEKVTLPSAFTVQPECIDDEECSESCRSASRCVNDRCVGGPVDKDNDGDGLLDSACGGDDCDDNNPLCTTDCRDADQDGACLPQDCDDGDASIHPNASELCDGVDNDCDGGLDEGSESNASCGPCEFFERASDPTLMYAWCDRQITWRNARDACFDLGGDLVVITSSAQNDFVASISQSNPWLGLSDRGQEGHWLWVDGSDAIVRGQTVGYENWNSDEPNDAGGEDCAEMMLPSTLWNDIPCTYAQTYACTHPR